MNIAVLSQFNHNNNWALKIEISLAILLLKSSKVFFNIEYVNILKNEHFFQASHGRKRKALRFLPAAQEREMQNPGLTQLDPRLFMNTGTPITEEPTAIMDNRTKHLDVKRACFFKQIKATEPGKTAVHASSGGMKSSKIKLYFPSATNLYQRRKFRLRSIKKVMQRSSGVSFDIRAQTEAPIFPTQQKPSCGKGINYCCVPINQWLLQWAVGRSQKNQSSKKNSYDVSASILDVWLR
ncbi:hypothetical protein CEXT_171341 [Caerostris extrusa]|uniref:Uncharacterized protein n=1 Tax=Caerostris extrusa TaxID=172846 RepID=A0AAV4Y3F3_CAEEX|nr:hypothetical protein CEXT_171341 [Caerostris extrusa]